MKIKTAFFILLASILVLGSSGCGLVKNALGIGDEGALGELVGEVIEGIGESDPESEPEPAAPATPEPQSPADAPEPDPEPEEPGESEDQSVDMAGLTALEQLDSYAPVLPEQHDGRQGCRAGASRTSTPRPHGPPHRGARAPREASSEFIQLADVFYIFGRRVDVLHVGRHGPVGLFAEPTGGAGGPVQPGRRVPGR